jgi:hypothetical protein
VRENRYYSEDWTFCENWRDLGGQVWVDKRVLLRHVGTYVFDGASQDKLYNDLAALVKGPTHQIPSQIPEAHAAAKQEVAVGEPEVLASSQTPATSQ